MTKFKSEITSPQATFLEWALEQPKVRRIDHTEGWSACAVGDYHREATDGVLTSKHNGYARPVGFTNYSEYAEHILPKDLLRILNINGDWPGGNLATYGDLQAYIRRHYVGNDDESESS